MPEILENEMVANMRDLTQRVFASKRYGTRPFMAHCDEVTQYVWDRGYRDPEILAAAQGHDLIEDSDITQEDLLDRGIPLVVVHFIGGLTFFKSMCKPETLSLSSADTASQLKIAMAQSNPGSHVIKVGDSACNLVTSLEPRESDNQEDRLQRVGIYKFNLAVLKPGMPQPAEVTDYIKWFNSTIPSHYT